MAQVKNKRLLREMARRYAKGVILSAIGSEAFFHTGLSDEEEQEVWDELRRIADRVTKEDAALSATELVDEYFDPPNGQSLT